MDRLIEFVRQVGAEAERDPRSTSGWHLRFWSKVAHEINTGEVADEVIVVLMQHGFNAEDARMSQPPPLLQLYQVLEEMKMGGDPQEYGGMESDEFELPSRITVGFPDAHPPGAQEAVESFEFSAASPPQRAGAA
eukprot:CAMPEP_0183448238 /NCGR_PEP_ID=MMETSP0370-20130417/105619_1 /TAXON_ID=268820 /ORGANISM="Peridinium aciculiferum, Strain PAER-2" /LENGTH=134 /DNA_ID=CAMNT_0025639173 /DNA_START=23 /DNA_END=428 /DNA_ORIENTATION=+